MSSRTIRFENGFHGELELDSGIVKIGRDAGQAQPYDLLYGALASCLYATFLGILEKKRIQIESTEVVIEGQKRTEVPTTLEKVHITVTIKVDSQVKQESVLKSFELATKHCSVYQTISQVAGMSWEVKFI